MTIPHARESRLNVLFVGDFSASKVGNQSVAEDLVARLDAHGIRPFTTSNRLNKLYRVGDMALTAWRQGGKIDVASVDVFSGPAFRWAELVVSVLRRQQVPIVLVLHGGGLPRFAERHPHRVRKLFGSAARIVTPSRYLGEELKPYLEGYTLIPNPVQTSNYAFRLRSQAAPRLVWVRSFHKSYNPVLAAQVMGLLKRDFPDGRCVMVGKDRGDGSLADTKRVAVELGVSDRLEFVGPVPKAEVPKWLATGDVFINTTTVDNTPVSVIEAMASGLCVVSTSVGGIPYLVQDEKHALLVPSGDAPAMAQAIRRILSEPGLSARLSADGRKLAEAFDWNVVLPLWSQLLWEVGRTRGRSRSGSRAGA